MRVRVELFPACSWRQAGIITSCFNCGSAGRSDGSSGGETCFDDNGAGHHQGLIDSTRRGHVTSGNGGPLFRSCPTKTRSREPSLADQPINNSLMKLPCASGDSGMGGKLNDDTQASNKHYSSFDRRLPFGSAHTFVAIFLILPTAVTMEVACPLLVESISPSPSRHL